MGGEKSTAEQAEIAALRKQVRKLGGTPVTEWDSDEKEMDEEAEEVHAALVSPDEPEAPMKSEAARGPAELEVNVGVLADGTKIHHRLVLFTISMNAILVMACNTMFIPAISIVQAELDTTPTMVALCITVYTLGSGITPLVMGPVADVIGRRKPMLISHVIFIVATICAALAPSIELLLVARTLEALGGCTFLVLGQAQVGDIYPQEQLGKALAFFSLSRMSAALFGPVVGGVICQYFGWRATFWTCAGLDIILAIVCFFHVPETLLTPQSERPSVSITMPFRPLAEIGRDRSVGFLCFLGALNHGMVYMMMVLVPLFGPMLTSNSSVIGLMILPATIGTVSGSMKAGKMLSKVKGSDAKHVEWKGVSVGMLINFCATIFYGWLAVSICIDDGVFIQNDASGEWSRVTADETSTIAHANVTTVFDNMSPRQAKARLAAGVECVGYNLLPAIGTALCQYVMGFGGSISMVAGTTYLALARPASRSSIAASQRFAQQIGGATSVTVCGFLFGAVGPAWTGTLLGLMALLCMPLILCISRDPEGPKKRQAQSQYSVVKSSSNADDEGQP